MPQRFFPVAIALMTASCGFLSRHNRPSPPLVTPSMALTPVSSANPGRPPHVQPLALRPGCGFVQVGAQQIPLDCPSPAYSEIPSAARPLLPDHVFSPEHVGAAELPAVVDHREDGTEGPMRNQGVVGACSALSFASAIDHALARRGGNRVAVSAMHVWARYHEPSMARAVEKNRNRELTSEANWPYTVFNQLIACSWVQKSQCMPYCGADCSCRMPAEHCGRDVDSRELAQADANPIARFTNITHIDHSRVSLMRALAQGQDVWISMNVANAAFDSERIIPEHDGLRSVIAHFEPYDTWGSHAMLIAGYRVRPSGTYFLLHNSWGETWGDGGYAWVHEKTLEMNIVSAYLVDAEPWDPSQGKPPLQLSQCVNGFVSDTATGQCAPPCVDGSAQHNGVCPAMTNCPAGYVYVFGACALTVLSPFGHNPSTGVVWMCGADGCVYAAPFGSLGCTEQPWCSMVCPLPRFRLGYGALGVWCTE